MAGRRAKAWFTPEGKPLLHDGLYKNSPEGCFLYDFRFRGKHHKGSTEHKNENQARAWLESFRERLREQKRSGKAAPLTLRETYARWLEVRGAEVDASHADAMRVAITVHAAEYADLPIISLDNMAANKIRSAYLQSTGKGHRTGGGHVDRTHNAGGANQLIKNLYALCGWGVEVGLIQARPFRLKKLEVTPPEKSMLWPEQVAAFLAEADKGKTRVLARDPNGKAIHELCPHSATAARMMVYLGLREDETRHAEWCHVDWRTGVFRVARGEVVDHEPKDRDKRAIQIPKPMLDHLKARHAEAGNPLQGLILPDRGTTARQPPPNTPHEKQFSEKNIARAGALIKAPGLTPHALRRCFATTHYELGTPISQIAKMLGHASPETTLKHYIVTRDKDQTEAQDRLAKAYESPNSPHKKTPTSNIKKNKDLQADLKPSKP